ncbi:InlB B-repeat-containing protein [Alkalibacter mobilis]|uniref:InlB B-repeat-containing protein n=1 Tax=Alkalibacter mobilis TaxID=2787712 RepID=UPI0018A10621|nr:InlB B-repeat-containing protein [Alkalibacter mobilis]MBF7095529.1 InlB B-repeat-containing protein [Alkalibacter mobilis]
MKKKTVIVLGIIAMAAMAVGALVIAKTLFTQVTQGDFAYYVRGENAILNEYTGSAKDLEIPAVVTSEGVELKVSTIGSDAFLGNETLERVVVGDHIKSIENSAFGGCTSLKKVEFLGDAPQMGENVFIDASPYLELVYAHDKIGYGDTFGYSATPFYYIEYLDYESENGSLPADENRYGLGSQITAKHNTGILTRTGYTFTGWSTSPGEDTNVFEEGETFTLTESNTKLYPHWTINEYEIFFEDKGGLGFESKIVEHGSLVEYPGKPEKSGYVFIDWFKDKEFNEKWDFDSEYIVEETTIYGKWLKNPQTPKGMAAVTGGYDQIDLSWKKSDGAQKYQIFKSDSPDGNYVRVVETTTNTYSDKKLEYRKTYYYKVKALAADEDVKLESDFSSYASAKTNLLTPAGFSAARIEPKGIKISWKSSVGATGYEVYHSNSSSGNFELLTKVTGTSYSDANSEWTESNYYKTRAYRTVGDTQIYSDFTEVKGYYNVGNQLYNYLSSLSNRNSVSSSAIRLNNGYASNACVYFASEALRRVGVPVSKTMNNIDRFLPYLTANGWVKERDYTKLKKGDICFTTDSNDDKNGRPTHTYIFMGWVVEGDYNYAYICDNQAQYYDNQVLHVRNFLNRDEHAGSEKEPFSFFMTLR